jgi:hypothetical protein
MPTTFIILVAGERFPNTQSLSAVGLKQAKKAGEDLKHHTFHKVLCSGMPCAPETAKLVCFRNEHTRESPKVDNGLQFHADLSIAQISPKIDVFLGSLTNRYPDKTILLVVLENITQAINYLIFGDNIDETGKMLWEYPELAPGQHFCLTRYSRFSSHV